MYLFAVNTNGTAQLCASLDFYGCQMIDDGNHGKKLREFIPAYDTNNVICLYDKVENKYYYSEGSNFNLSK